MAALLWLPMLHGWTDAPHGQNRQVWATALAASFLEGILVPTFKEILPGEYLATVYVWYLLLDWRLSTTPERSHLPWPLGGLGISPRPWRCPEGSTKQGRRAGRRLLAPHSNAHPWPHLHRALSLGCGTSVRTGVCRWAPLEAPQCRTSSAHCLHGRHRPKVPATIHPGQEMKPRLGAA